MIQKVPITQIKLNPNNPRVIKDDKFKQLVKSIRDLPEMGMVRPIVVNKDMIVLGGNMRLKAMKEVGIKEVPITIVDWDEDKQRQFIIKDNIGYGEWDFDMLANEWDELELQDWGMTMPHFGHQINDLNENDLDMTEEFDLIETSSGLQKVVFIFDGPEEAESYLKNAGLEVKKQNQVWQINLCSQSTL